MGSMFVSGLRTWIPLYHAFPSNVRFRQECHSINFTTPPSICAVGQRGTVACSRMLHETMLRDLWDSMNLNNECIVLAHEALQSSVV
jgi:hypothetical protein